MLDAIHIKRNNIYITNVVNYRPPNNRKPEPSEINRYSNYLRQHIAIIDPKILILMGSTAMESLFGSKIKILMECKCQTRHGKTFCGGVVRYQLSLNCPIGILRSKGKGGRSCFQVCDFGGVGKLLGRSGRGAAMLSPHATLRLVPKTEPKYKDCVSHAQLT